MPRLREFLFVTGCLLCLGSLALAEEPVVRVNDEAVTQAEITTTVQPPPSQGESSSTQIPDSAVPAPSSAKASTVVIPPLKVSPSMARVRSQDGTQVCSLARGSKVEAIGRTADGDELQVKVSGRHCPPTGFIDIRDLRASYSADAPYDQANVDEVGLSLRSEPRVNERTYKCAMPKGTALDVLPREQQGETTNWLNVRLKNPPPGCAKEGWVAASYLRPSVNFDSLPVIRESQTQTEAEACGDKCEAATAHPNDLASDIERAASKGPSGENPFLSAIEKMRKNHAHCDKQSAYACHRGLLQMPLIGRNAGFCGSHHYNPDRPYGVDAYASPLAACNILALAQEWKKDVCPNRSGCTFQWGDISNRTRPRFNGHTDHTDGECMDVRLMRKGGFVDGGQTYRSSTYDRAETAKFIALAKELGASQVIFNDPKIKVSRAGGHNNHVHVCFRDNPKARATCDHLQIDPKVCPEVQ